MKKVLIVVVTAFVLSIGLSSCKTYETCPAYSNADAIEVEQNS